MADTDKVKEALKSFFKSGSSYNIALFFVLTVIVHVIDAYFSFDRRSMLGYVMGMYIFIALLAAFFVYKSDKILDWTRIGACLGISFLCIILPFLSTKLTAVFKLVPTAYISGIILFAPIWPLLVIFSNEDNKFVKFVGTSYILFWFFLFTVYFAQNVETRLISLNSEHIKVLEPLQGVWNTVVKIAKDIWAGLLALPENIGKAQKRLEAEALGEYYTGEIDQNAQQRLGVYIENIQAADSSFYEDQPVTIWGTLIAQTIDEPIQIKIGCTKNEKDAKEVEIYPKDTFDIDMSEEEGIECTFTNRSLPEGSHEVGLKADFNFLTMAYIKTYFMDTENKRALSSQNIDPLDYYQIADKEPGAIYTNGPVMIGLDLGKPPLMTDREFRFGITLTNNWEGNIKEVTDMYLIMPNSVEMGNQRSDGYYCGGKRNYLFEKSSCSDIGEEDKGCKDSTHNVFKMKTTGEKIKDVDDFETLLCRFNIIDAQGLLGEVPLATRYFKVVARYNYTISKEIGVTVRGGDGLKIYFNETQCSTTCEDKDGCICPLGCVINLDTEIGKGANCGGPKGDGQTINLTDCLTNCTDPDGCICLNTCKIQGKINYNNDCGGYLDNIDVSGSGTCSADGWKDICSECQNARDPNDALIYEGIFCVNNKWVCTNIANSEETSYKPLEDCP